MKFKSLLRIVILVALAPLALGALCDDVPIQHREVVQVPELTCEWPPYLRIQANLGSGWFIPEWTRELDPPVAKRDCAAIVPGTNLQLRALCCGYWPAEELDFCPPEGTPLETNPHHFGQGCSRIFKAESGKEYNHHTVWKFNKQHGLPHPVPTPTPHP
jgi:hypothetical protein